MARPRGTLNNRTGLSRQSYANHLGVKIGEVQKLARKNMLIFHPDGSINVEATDRAIAGTIDRNVEPLENVERTVNSNEIDHITVSNARKAYYQAELEKIEYETALGELIKRKDTEDTVFRGAREVRDHFQLLPSRLAKQLVGMNDEQEIYFYIQDEVNSGLELIVDTFMEYLPDQQGEIEVEEITAE